MIRIRLMQKLGLLEPTVRLARWSVQQGARSAATSAQPAEPHVLGYHAAARSR